MMKLMYDIYWTAAMVDGEGSILLREKKQTPAVVVSNTDMEIHSRLQAMWGGNIYPSKSKTNFVARKPCYTWTVICNQAIGLMMTIYPLMTTRRQQRIREVIVAWKALGVRVELREEEALQAMRRVYAGERLRDVARSVCIHKYTLAEWMAGRKRPELLAILQEEGDISASTFEAFAQRRKKFSTRVDCSDERALEAIRRVRNGEASYAVSQAYGVAWHTVKGWVRGHYRPHLLARVLEEEQQQSAAGDSTGDTLPLPLGATPELGGLPYGCPI